MGRFRRWRQARRAKRPRERLRRLDRPITANSEEHRLCDGDVVPFPGYPRWAELLTRELPELAQPAEGGPLVRPYVRDRPSTSLRPPPIT